MSSFSLALADKHLDLFFLFPVQLRQGTPKSSKKNPKHHRPSYRDPQKGTLILGSPETNPGQGAKWPEDTRWFDAHGQGGGERPPRCCSFAAICFGRRRLSLEDASTAVAIEFRRQWKHCGKSNLREQHRPARDAGASEIKKRASIA